MKPFLHRASGVLCVLLAAHVARAQVFRLDLTSPANESSIQYQPGAAPTTTATAAAFVNSAGQVASITVTAGGTGYTSAPSVVINGNGAGSGAVGLASLTFGVTSVNLLAGGANYTSAPTVTFSGGGGSGATATAAFDATTKQVTSITITSAGTGYSSAPLVSITGGGGSGASASAVLGNGAVSAVTVFSPGFGYVGSPTVSFTGGGGTGATATLTLTPGAVSGFTMINNGAGYTTAPAVTIVGGGGTGATATATISNGLVTGLTITNPGSGYVTAPTVTIAAPPPPPGTVLLQAKVTGSDLVAYDTQFFINGAPIAAVITHDVTFQPSAIWTAPQPGSYFVTAKSKDTVGNAFTTPASRIFVTGSKIFSPIAHTAMPLGSSVVMNADGQVGTTAVNPFTGQTVFTPGFIKQIAFDVFDGSNTKVFTGSATAYPYSISFTPQALGFYKIVATATDNNDVTYASTDLVDIQVVRAIGTPPTCRIVNPINNGSVAAGNAVNIIADAGWAANDPNPGKISKVEFYRDGVLTGTSQTFPFTATWTPVVPGRYVLVALAFDDKGNVITSAPTTINVTGGLPTVQLTSPTNGTSVVQGAKLTVGVSAGGSDGGIGSLSTIEFLVDGNVNDSLPKVDPSSGTLLPLTEPFVFTWKSNVTLGSHKLAARVTDRNKLTITSAEVAVNVVVNQLPQVTINSPATGSSSAVNAPVTIAASATDADGSVDTVEFFANGSSLGNPVTKAPFQFTWTPTASGVYLLTAKATDNAGGAATSDPVSVTIDPAPVTAAGSSATAITVYRGDFASSSETGHFALAVNRNGRGTFVGFSTAPTGRTYFWTDFAVSDDGTFAVRDSAGAVLLSGQTSASGVSGTFGNRTFIGPITVGSSSATPLMFVGALDNVAGSSVIVIVGADNSITLYTASGTNREVGSDFLTSTGGYAFTAATGGRFTGTVTVSNGIVAGTVSGTVNGSFLLRQQPGRLVNLSTRSLAGNADRTLVTGFVIRGTGAKPLLVRAVGPTLANFGVPTPLADPTLAVVSSTGATIASNDNWASTPAFVATTAQVGAFALNPNSRDAALVVSPAPGMYSVVVGGASSTLANVLVELYDADTSLAPTARLGNISTRGQVAAGDSLLAGFVIAGDQKKKLLIRAIGPTLANFGVINVLTDPKFDVLAGTSTVASNNDWGSGSGVATVTATTPAVGAFPLPAGSKDAALVVQLNPGAYTVQVSGNNGLGGTVLVEIYDADP